MFIPSVLRKSICTSLNMNQRPPACYIQGKRATCCHKNSCSIMTPLSILDPFEQNFIVNYHLTICPRIYVVTYTIKQLLLYKIQKKLISSISATSHSISIQVPSIVEGRTIFYPVCNRIFISRYLKLGIYLMVVLFFNYVP